MPKTASEDIEDGLLLRSFLPSSPVYTPLTSRRDFRAINAGGGGGGGGGGKEIFGGLTSNAEEKGERRREGGREGEGERAEREDRRICTQRRWRREREGERTEGVRNNRVSE